MANEPLCNVVIFNDDVTPMDFVVQVLQDVFGLDFDDACKLMLRVHHEGQAICGTSEREAAAIKLNAILALASEHNHPFKCSLEEAH